MSVSPDCTAALEQVAAARADTAKARQKRDSVEAALVSAQQAMGEARSAVDNAVDEYRALLARLGDLSAGLDVIRSEAMIPGGPQPDPGEGAAIQAEIASLTAKVDPTKARINQAEGAAAAASAAATQAAMKAIHADDAFRDATWREAAAERSALNVCAVAALSDIPSSGWPG